MKMHRALAGIVLAAAGTVATGQVVFLASDDDVLYRGTPSGVTNTFTVSDFIRGMAVVGGGAAVNGANTGDVIAVNRRTGGQQPIVVYRVDNAFSGTPTLVKIAEADQTFSDIAFANGKIYGVRTSAPTGVIQLIEFDSDFNTVNNYFTNIPVFDAGAGGLAYNASKDVFYVTDPDSDKIWEVSLGGGETEIGATGVKYNNNDLDHFKGTLYAALHDESDDTFHFGRFSKGTGAWSSIVNIGPYLGGAVGLVVVPAPGSLALLGLGGLVAMRRRR
ncbi:MAG: PQQ-like beta-propeller repeat protein [Phycisphaeraceae bacterium]|nr:PQQ-like beta-propeller repeat protein [Phycisphaeraceae bacterium]